MSKRKSNTSNETNGPPKKKPKKTKGHKLPIRLPAGEILTDSLKKKWYLGQAIGQGGFGEIYSASDKSDKEAIGSNAAYVIKIEDHGNGPLFVEMHFYMNAARSNEIEKWKQDKSLDFLGMPHFIASGSHHYNENRLRFMVMERFGEDLQKILDKNNRVLPLKAVFTLGSRIIDVLEYIHSTGYVHADIKASNLLLGRGKQSANEVFLVDFGLACKFNSGDNHKANKADPRKTHDGTIEFTSRDAHTGTFARRSDLEILGYNMLQWLCQKLPWEDNLEDLKLVAEQKNMYMADIPLLIKKCFTKRTPPPEIEEYLRYVADLSFEEKPDYDLCRNMFKRAITHAGFKDDKKLIFQESKTSKSKKVIE